MIRKSWKILWVLHCRCIRIRDSHGLYVLGRKNWSVNYEIKSLKRKRPNLSGVIRGELKIVQVASQIRNSMEKLDVKHIVSNSALVRIR